MADAPRHRGVAPVVRRRLAHAGRRRRQRRRAGRRARVGDAGRGAATCRHGFPRWSPPTTPRRSAGPSGWWRSGRARSAGSPPRCRNVWEADWCGHDHAVAITSEGAGEDAWYGAGVALVDLATGEERPAGHERRAARLGSRHLRPGDKVAVIEAVCSDRVVVCGDLRVIDVATATMTPVDLGDVEASRVIWIDDDRLLVFGRRGLSSLALQVGLDEGSVRELWATDGSVGELYHPSGAAVRRRHRGAHVLARPPAIDRARRRGRHGAGGRRAAAPGARSGARRCRAAARCCDGTPRTASRSKGC